MASGVTTKSALRFGSNLGQYPLETSGTDELLLGNYDLISILNESLVGTPKYERKPNLTGGIGYVGQDLISQDYGGEINIEGQYDGLNQLFTASFGALTKTQVSTNEYTHEYTLSDDLSQADGKPRRVTIGFDKKTSIWVARSCMVSKLIMNYDIRSGLNISATIIPYDIINNSTVNTSSSSWKMINTYSSHRILGHQLAFKIDGSCETIKSFQIELDNNLVVPPKTIQSGLKIPEPVTDGYRFVSGSITFPRYENDDYMLDKYSDTTRALSIVFTGGAMDTINKSLEISLPYAKFNKSSNPINNSGAINKTLQFDCHKSISSSDMITLTLKNRYPYNDLLGER